MTDTQDRILKGCKFIIGLGSQRWDSEITKKALNRLDFLIKEELDMLTLPEPEATPEYAEKLFQETS